jgi:hypothetical protein
MLRYPLGSCSSLPHGARPASAHRVGVAFSKGPELLPFYAHILSVTFPVSPHTNNFSKRKSGFYMYPGSWIPGGTRTIPVLRESCTLHTFTRSYAKMPSHVPYPHPMLRRRAAPRGIAPAPRVAGVPRVAISDLGRAQDAQRTELGRTTLVVARTTHGSYDVCICV